MRASITERGIHRQGRLLEGYLLNMPKGAAKVRNMIIMDIARLSDLGATRYAADLSEVLVLFDLTHPHLD